MHEDSVFNPQFVRGLGLSLGEPEGLGQKKPTEVLHISFPGSEPGHVNTTTLGPSGTGGGAGGGYVGPAAGQSGEHADVLRHQGLPTGVQMIAAPTSCKNWYLAFVDGAKRPIVAVSGYGFSYQKLVNYLKKLTYPGAPHFFTFSNNRAKYLFAFEVVSGRCVLKICTDGLGISHSPGGKSQWTVGPTLHNRQGVGQVYKTMPAYIGSGIFSGGGVQINPINHAVSGQWVSLGTIDSSNTFTPNDPTGQLAKFSDLQNTLQNWASNIRTIWQSNPKFGGYFYFGFSDTHSGGAQTGGEPPGMAIFRYNGTEIDMIPNEGANTGGGIATGGATGAAVSAVRLMSGAPSITSFQSAAPASGGGYYWYNYAWVCASSQAPTMAPPGAQPTQAGLLGAWVNIKSGYWVWYPGGQLVAMLGGDRNTYWVYSKEYVAEGTMPAANFPPPTGTPPNLPAGTAGQWANPFPGYFVFVPTAAAATTSYTWLWLLLGLGAAGGIGYYLLD